MVALPYKIEELLHRNARTQAYRARVRDTGEKVIVRVPARGQQPSALRREVELLDLLGVRTKPIHPRDAGLHVPTAVIAPDPSGAVLEPLLGASFELAAALPLAKSLVRQIDQAHRAGVVLRDVTPFNLLVDFSERRLNFISYGIASLIRRERSAVAHPESMEGALAYISPEQTGRMNREVDYRTDFYSLGVTLYQLLTGELPFESDDPLELVHAHIARTPPPPRRIESTVPKVLSQLILKLLAKNAEDRYQTCAGILRDLERLEQALAIGEEPNFELGLDDHSDKFLVPQELYGRREDLARLLEAFDRAANGSPELVLVSGNPGIGKTALVHELHRPTLVKRGFFAIGKFDMLAQTVPYTGFVTAFRELVHQLLTESVAAIAQWRQAFEKALGDQAQILVELIPELRMILGEQPPAVIVDTGSAEKRLRMLLTRFVQVFTAGLRPLVLFLDDLQWADAASMKLLEHLANTGDSRSLLVVGTYRDNEVDARHPLTLAIERLEQSEVVLSKIALAPLDHDAVTQLVADTLREHGERVDELATLLREKTDGNPFFLRQFFATLHESGTLYWLVDEQRWDWNIAKLRDLEDAPNVVDLMVSKLRKLPEPSQRVLELAACVGNRVELQTITKLMDRTPEQVHEDLWPAVQQGLVRASELHGHDARYTFVHDRVHEAAYSLLDPDQRQRVHLRVGRLLWRDRSEELVEARIFDICRHLNSCLELIDDADERHRLSKLELTAGRRAMASTAYESARRYFVAGLDLLTRGPDPIDSANTWDRDYELTFGLHRQLAECEYLLGELDAAEQHFDRILSRARTDLAKVEIFTLKAVLAYHNSAYAEGFASTQAGLAILGVDIPAVDDDEALGALAAQEAGLLAEALEGRGIAELIDLPQMSDPHALAQAALLNELSLLGMFINPALNGIGAVKRVRLSIERGNSRFSAPAYAAHGMIVGAVTRDRESGYAFGRLGLELAQRQGDRRAESQAGMWFGVFICHWGAPLDESIPVLAAGVEYGLRMGSPIWASFNAFFVPVHTLFAGRRLDAVDDMLDRYMPVLDYPSSYSGCVGYKQLVARLTGRPIDPSWYVEGAKTEEEFLAFLDQPTMQLPRKHFFVAKLTTLVILGRTLEAVELIERANASGDIAMVLFGQVAVIWWALIEGLALCDALIHDVVHELDYERASELEQDPGDEDEARREAWRAEIGVCRERLADYAAQAPMNFAHMHLLVEAEWARTEGRQLDALELYDKAIAAARDNDAGLVEALANERAAAFHRDQGRDSVATGYIREASHRYASWGATAKVEQLREDYPEEVAEHAERGRAGLTDSRAIDLTAVLRASRVLTSEIDLDRLLETTMTILLENAGAEQGVIIVAEGEELWVEAAGNLVGPRAEIQIFADNPIPLESAEQLPVCVSIAQYVLRTRETMVLDDAHERGRMVQNPYVAANEVRSVICTPLIHQGRLYGIVYLENNLVAGAFTPGRVETLKLLASHSVIAIQNARLYANLNRYSHELERVNKSMSRFVPSEFLRCLGKDRLVEVGLGQNVSKDMTILFSDIRGFTTLIENLPKPKHIEFINEYLQYMEPTIANNKGFVDSYIGDAIMALFEDNLQNAIQAGVDMSAELRELNGRRAARGEPPVNMGVGINSGPLTLGTIGGPTRIKCGVIGESVNLAARVQELTKRYRTFLLATDTCIEGLPDPSPYTVRVVGRVIVVGMNQPTTLYEVVDAEMRLPVRDHKLETLPNYERGVEAFYDRRFDEAAAEFDRCLAACPEDTPAQLYRHQCDVFRRAPPPAGWDGVARLSKKS